MPDPGRPGYRRPISTTLPLTVPFREAALGDGSPRPPYDAVFPPLQDSSLDSVQADVDQRVADAGVTFGGPDAPFRVDAIPRLIERRHWQTLEAGLIQRTRALDEFVRDIYSRQRIVREGIIGATAVATARYFEPLLQGALSDGRRWITIAGLDLVRGPDGAFRVLEDNVRTPSGLGYLMAARDAVHGTVPTGGLEPAPLDDAIAGFRAALHAAAPEGTEDPFVVLLTDGPASWAYWEHRKLAEVLDIALVRPVDLRSSKDGDLHALVDGTERRVDVVYRRTDEDWLLDPRGGRTTIAGQLMDPWLRNRVGLVNAFGTGVADDKLIHAHVEDMIRLYLDEEPLIASVPTWDLNQPGALARALDELHRLVVKPRAGSGGRGVVLGPYASEATLDRVRTKLQANPGNWVVQELLPLSLHPTVIDSELAPRHVDLRPFVVLGPGDDATVVPGGLTRVAFDAGEMIVNSSHNGGAKDTWIV